MKLLHLIIPAITLTLTACNSQKHEKSDDARVTDAACRDAEKVITAENDIFEQEKAVIAIRVRENALRDAGYDDEADQYIDIVSHILVDSLHILSDCH